MIYNPTKQSLAEIDKVIRVNPNSSIFFSILAFVSGFFSWHKTNVIGELYTTEIAILFSAIIIVFFKKNTLQIDGKLFAKYLLFCFFLLAGYIISDLIGQTPEKMYIRGWGRVALLLTDLIAMTVIFGVQRNTIIWFFLGMAIGNISILLIHGELNLNTFKFYWAIAVIQIICCIMPLFSIRLTALALIIAGLSYILFDFRSAGAIAIIVGGMLILSVKHDLKKIKILPVLFIGGLAIFAIKTTLEISSDKMETRRATSSLGRFAAINIGIKAIIDSPLIGTGSWGNNTEKYAKELYDSTKDDMRELGQQYHSEGKAFLAHSQIIQAWMEGGLLSASFFIFYGYLLFKSVYIVFIKIPINKYTALYGFNSILGFWHLFMSPFGGDHRIDIACCVAISISIIHSQKQIYFFNKKIITI
ncbi:MAG: hypothetical protein NTX38_08810 [Methylobacter sp.]|nr:hypothetical protein [Methylobacter sp.]